MIAMEQRLRGSLPARPPSLPARQALPLRGTRAEEVLAALVEAARRDGDGRGKLSGALYLPREGDDGDDEEEFVVVSEDGEGGEKEGEKEEEKKNAVASLKKKHKSTAVAKTRPLRLLLPLLLLLLPP